MSALHKFWRLSGSDRRLLLDAAIWLAAYRVALWVLPWNRLAAPRPLRDAQPSQPVSVERMEWAVRTASRRIPAANCLTAALALHHLMTRARYDSSIHIGVAKTPARGFEAHAWVEHDGVTLLNSAGEIAHYARLLALQTRSL